MFIRLMTLSRVKPRRAVTFVKYFTSIVPLVFLPKTLTWKKVALLASNLLNFPELVLNELKKSISKNIYQYYFVYPSYHGLT